MRGQGEGARGRREDGETGRWGEEEKRRPTSKAGENEKRNSILNSALKPADKVAIAYLVVITFLVLAFSFRVPGWPAFCAGHAILVALIIFVARYLPVSPSPLLTFSPSPSLPLSASPRITLGALIRGWYPVVLIPITYKELSYLIPRIHPRDFDEALAALDYRLLGVHPTVWLERFTWPPLTEVLQLTYSTYYFLPLVLGVVLWRRRSLEQFHFWVFIVVLGFYLSYLGYIAVPVIGPRFLPTILEAQTKPLTGLWLFQSVRDILDRAEGITHDCFPSGHTELTLLVLIYARSFHRKVFWWLLPLGTGVIISTVYLRYHYVIDVVAGALLAVGIVATAKPFYRLLGGDEIRESH